MKPGTVFVSHRAEYAETARKFKTAIEKTSKGKMQVFISEDIPRGEEWRTAIELQLQESESLFLLYGAPDEDWSWCFYEAVYFDALRSESGTTRRIYCLARPNIPPPGPLNHLQIVTDKEQLIKELLTLYEGNGVDFDTVEVRSSIDHLERNLFGELSHFVSYPRVYLTVADPNFGASQQIPPDALLSGDKSVMLLLFGVGRPSIEWGEIQSIVSASVPNEQKFFVTKWIDETSNILLAARESRFMAPQTVLISPGGARFRFLLYSAKREGDGRYCYEFLAIDEVGGPALGLPNQLLSLLTGIRMGFRLRYELIRRFPSDFDDLSDADRRIRIKEIQRIIDNLSTESATRGNFNLEDLLSAFDDFEADRIRKITSYWPSLKDELYNSLGLSPDGKVIDEHGLQGVEVDRFKLAFDALRLINIEFMSRCCVRVSRMIARSDDELEENAAKLDLLVRRLRGGVVFARGPDPGAREICDA